MAPASTLKETRRKPRPSFDGPDWARRIGRTQRSPSRAHSPVELTVERVDTDVTKPGLWLGVDGHPRFGTIPYFNGYDAPRLLDKVGVGSKLIGLANLHAADVSELILLKLEPRSDYARTAAIIQESLPGGWVELVIPAIHPRKLHRINLNGYWHPYQPAVPGAGVELAAHLERGSLESGLPMIHHFDVRPSEADAPPVDDDPFYTAFVEILDVRADGSCLVDVSGWPPGVPVELKPSDFPWYLRPVVAKGKVFAAEVNLEARRAEDLVFHGFEVVPEPSDADVERFLSLLARD